MFRAGSDAYGLTDESSLELLSMYREREFMWNRSIRDYSNREKRQTAYEEIANDMGLPGFEPRHVRIKIRSYRDMYLRELRSKKKERPFWFKHLDFLREHVKSDKVTRAEYTESDEENVTSETLKPDPESRGRRRGEIEEADVEPLRCDHLERLKTEIVTRLEGTECTILNAIKRESDYFDNFAQYTAGLLRALPKRRAYALQNKIINIITDEHNRFITHHSSLE